MESTWAERLIEVSDGLLITGTVMSGGVTPYEFSLVKLDTLGNWQWTRVYRGLDDDVPADIKPTMDGGCIIVGRTESFSDHNEVLLVKADAEGHLQWARTYSTGHDTFGNSVEELSDGGFLIGGTTFDADGNIARACMIRTNSSAAVVWSRKYQRVTDYSRAIAWPAASGGYMLAGTLFGQVDYFLLHTDDLGATGCEEDGGITMGQPALIELSPQDSIMVRSVTAVDDPAASESGGSRTAIPCSGTTFIDATAPIAPGILLGPSPTPGPVQVSLSADWGGGTYTVHDGAGRTVRQGPAAAGATLELDLSALGDGVYTVRFTAYSSTPGRDGVHQARVTVAH
jgi:hypothetical protein